MLLLTFEAPKKKRECAVYIEFNSTTRLYECILHAASGRPVKFASHWEFNKALTLLDDGCHHFGSRGWHCVHLFVDTFLAELFGTGRDFAAGQQPQPRY